MTGYVLLSQMRSGTTWLCSLANSSGVMGDATEWLIPGFIDDKKSPKLSAEEHRHKVITSASTPNGRFGMKIFPQHLSKIRDIYGYDFIAESRKDHRIGFVLLSRRDTLRQAISMERYRTRRRTKSGKAPEYNFRDLCNNIIYVEESQAFWRAYLGINQIDCKSFVYEDLVEDPSPYLEHLASFLEVELPSSLTTTDEIGRDELTEEWVERFRGDVAQQSVLPKYRPQDPRARTVPNFIRFLTRQDLR